MSNKVFVIFLVAVQINCFAQENDFSVKLNGYVNWTAIYDSRQTVSARENHFLLYPKPVDLNSEGVDLNSVPSYNMAVIQTRIGMTVNGPEFLSAKTTGKIEAEFMGNSNSDVNGFRIRHALLNLNWGNTSLLLGQTWNPMFVTEVYPYQIGSNGGAPFQPFARNPQIRLTQQINEYKIMFALVTERDYSSYGPNGASGEYLRNAIIPDLHCQVQANYDHILIGAGGEYKKLRPMSATETGYATDETISSYSFMGYSKIKFGKLSIGLEGVYGSNLASYTMLGGYAVKYIDPVTSENKYTPIKTMSVWSDIELKTFLDLGIFIGYSENLGAEDPIVGEYYSRGSNIKNLLRFAPRVGYTEGKVKMLFEVEYTSANYGTADYKGIVKNVTLSENLRIYTSVYFMLN